jgi:hypothetical protein
MPCFESETRDKIKVPTAVSRAFMDAALEHIKVGRSYPEALDQLAITSGLQPETINSILRRDPKTFSITKQAIARAGQTRMLRNAAEGFAEQLKGNGEVYHEPGRIAKAWDIQRRIALGGHSPVFPWTHMRNWAVQIPTAAGRARMGAFWRSAVDVWKYGGERGRALYEMDMGLMQMGDRYDFWKQSGADIQPGKRTPGDILLQTRKPSWQTRNFDSLKTARYTALEDVWSRLDPALKEGDTGKALGAMLARDMDYATGSVMPPVGEAINPLSKTTATVSQMTGQYNLLLSSKLFFAKHMDAWLSPLRYLAKGGRATIAEKAARNVALKRWANTVAAHLGVLGVNYAFNKAMGWQPPNLTDPNKSDYLRLRVGNHVVPFSPMLEGLRLPIVITAAMVAKGSDDAGTRLWRAVWNAAHPAFHTLYEQTSGKNFMGQKVPSVRNYLASKGVVSPPTDKFGKPLKDEMGVPEYLGTKLPIAAAGATEEYVRALKDQGVDKNQAEAFVKAALSGASSAIFGMHSYEDQSKTPTVKGRATTSPFITRQQRGQRTIKPSPF